MEGQIFDLGMIIIFGTDGSDSSKQGSFFAVQTLGNLVHVVLLASRTGYKHESGKKNNHKLINELHNSSWLDSSIAPNYNAFWLQ